MPSPQNISNVVLYLYSAYGNLLIAMKACTVTCLLTCILPIQPLPMLPLVCVNCLFIFLLLTLAHPSSLSFCSPVLP